MRREEAKAEMQRNGSVKEENFVKENEKKQSVTKGRKKILHHEAKEKGSFKKKRLGRPFQIPREGQGN